VSVNPPRERNDSQQGYSNAGSAPQGGMDMDSEIPFGPAWRGMTRLEALRDLKAKVEAGEYARTG
jgi:hypothetical protein